MRLDRECPGVKSKNSYAGMGPFDAVDIVESDDPTRVEKAAMIIRALPWHQFLDAL